MLAGERLCDVVASSRRISSAPTALSLPVCGLGEALSAVAASGPGFHRLHSRSGSSYKYLCKAGLCCGRSDCGPWYVVVLDMQQCGVSSSCSLPPDDCFAFTVFVLHYVVLLRFFAGYHLSRSHTCCRCCCRANQTESTVLRDVTTYLCNSIGCRPQPPLFFEAERPQGQSGRASSLDRRREVPQVVRDRISEQGGRGRFPHPPGTPRRGL